MARNDQPDLDTGENVLTQPPVRDEDGDLDHRFLDLVTAAIEARDSARAIELAGDLHEADLGDILEALSPEERPALIELLGREFDFTALTEVDETIRVQILEDLPPDVVAEGVRELDSDDAVYILEDLDQEDTEEILSKLPTTERAALQRSLDYPDESAGRRMQTDFLAVPTFWTVSQTVDYIREQAELPGEFFEVFVIDPGFRLIGGVSLASLLRSPVKRKMFEMMTEQRHVVHATDEMEDVARLFQRYNLVSVAVVDDAERLVGMITIDDVVDVIQEEAEEDIRALAGVGDEEISDSVLYTLGNRMVWLFVNLATCFVSSGVISLFGGSIEKMVALAVLGPVIASQGGNAATQTMTVVVRGLAMRELDEHNAKRIILREFTVGLLNGLIFAMVLGGFTWAAYSSFSLGAVIGAAMITNLVAAALGGFLVPMVLDRFGADPAVSSGAFVTTITDSIGYLATLGLATWWFGL